MDNRKINTQLANGRQILLRPMRPDDEDRLRDGIDKLSARSRYMRFFSGVQKLPDAVIKRLVSVDGRRHIAWGAIDIDASGRPAIGAAHAIRTEMPGSSDLALGVLDAYHGEGLARALIAAVLYDCDAQGIRQIRADVLLENKKAQRLFRAIGGICHTRSGFVLQYTFQVSDSLGILRAMQAPNALRDVFDQIETVATKERLAS